MRMAENTVTCIRNRSPGTVTRKDGIIMANENIQAEIAGSLVSQLYSCSENESTVSLENESAVSLENCGLIPKQWQIWI